MSRSTSYYRPDYQQPDTAPEPEAIPSNGPCSHWCNNKWRKAVKAYNEAVKKWVERGCAGAEPQPALLEPWPGEPNVCRKCGTVVRSALRELPKAYDALASVKFLTRSASADDERRGRSDVAPSPSPGADHQDEILRLACEWEDALRRHLGHQAAIDHFGNPQATLAGAVDYLNANYRALADEWDYDIVEEFANDIHKAYGTAVAMVKNKPIRRTLPVACPTCDLETLIQEEGAPGKPWYVECSERLGGCSRLFSENEYEFFVLLIKDGHVTTGASS